MVKPKAKDKYKMPEKIKQGTLLKTTHSEWILGSALGSGGFGAIYSAAKIEEQGTKPAAKSYTYAVKIEPKENGPLFTEINSYMRILKIQDVEEYMEKEKIKFLGIPPYVASGISTIDSIPYRFLVIHRYGRSIENLFQEFKKLPLSTVCKIAIHVITALKYIHSKDLVHGDIKGANILLGDVKNVESAVYLMDFGLITPVTKDKEFKRNPKRAHNGTFQYMSSDYHSGVPTKRSDLESLGYNLIHWISSRLPWEKDEKNLETVHKKKQEMMANVKKYMKENYAEVPSAITEFLHYVSQLKFNDNPNYKLCLEIFSKELKKQSVSLESKLDFDVNSETKSTGTKRQKNVKLKEEAEPPSKASKTINKNKKPQIQTEDNEPLPEEMSDLKNNERSTNLRRKILNTQLPNEGTNGSHEVNKPAATIKSSRVAKRKNDVPSTKVIQQIESKGDDEISPIKVPKKVVAPKRVTVKKTKAQVIQQIESKGDDEISPIKVPKKVVAPKRVTVKKTKAQEETKLSWRDAPTMARSTRRRNVKTNED